MHNEVQPQAQKLKERMVWLDEIDEIDNLQSWMKLKMFKEQPPTNLFCLTALQMAQKSNHVWVM